MRCTDPISRLAAFFVLSLITFLPPCWADYPSLEQLGWIEKALIHPENFQIHAKLDSGADTCSIHSEDIEYFKKRGERYVRFTIENRYGESMVLTSKLVRTARIKTKRGEPEERPVVRLGVCLGAQFEFVEFTLVDRSRFIFPLLIGRNFLAGKILVDSSKTYTTEPNCVEAES